MTWKLVLVSMLCIASAFALTPNSFNTRPVTIATGGEPTLQQILDNIFGVNNVNAVTDQSQAAMWATTGVAPKAHPELRATFAADSEEVGLYSDHSGVQTLVGIFNTSAVVGDTATIRFNADGTIDIGADAFTPASHINSGNFTGINESSFGFYLKDVSAGATYYTSDNLNTTGVHDLKGGTARAVAYDYAPLSRWAIAFEDGSDFDYNDRVIAVESIMPVPEPASIVLFGTLLVLCGSAVRRRKLS